MTPALRDHRNLNRDDDEISDTSSQLNTTGHGHGKPTRHTDEPVKDTPSLADRAHAELSEFLDRCNSYLRNNNNNSNSNSGGAGSTAATSTNSTTTTTITDPLPLPTYREAFPVACKMLLHSLPGNRNCIDCCNALDPEWAAISYGALVCIRCSGRHRSLGVAISQVRSVTMDHWTHREVVLMLEGGNAQVGGFFARHALTKKEFQTQQTAATTTPTARTHHHHQRSQSQPQRSQPQQSRSRSQSQHGHHSDKAQRRTSLTADNVVSLRYKTKAALFYKNQLEAHVGRLLEDPARKPYRGRSKSKP